MKIDVTKKLVKGKKVKIEGGEQRWISFRYERIPNFCYRCGLRSHDLRDCAEASDKENHTEQTTLQYGPWLRGKVSRRSRSEAPKGGLSFGLSRGEKQSGDEERLLEKDSHVPPMTEGLGGGEGSTLHNLGSRNTENETNGADSRNQTLGNIHERGLDSGIRLNTGSFLSKERKI